jgi:hypothetical protein
MAGGTYMPKAKILYMNTHKYVDVGEFPCPMLSITGPAIVGTEYFGLPAYWSDGHIFVLDGTTDLPPALDWVTRLKE